MSKKALVLFAEGSEELEAVTLINILRRGGVTVIVAGLSAGPLRGSRGTVIVPDTTLDNVQQENFDLVVLPGGLPGTTHLRNDPRVITLLQRQHDAGKQVAAICAAPSVLAAAGLLRGKRATSYPTCLDEFPEVLQQNEAVVSDGNIVTSRGPGTAMDFALTLLERLAGPAKRAEVEASLVR
ncbi:MAG: DJ-1/PfpI family protein [Sideroxydans sp.]